MFKSTLFQTENGRQKDDTTEAILVGVVLVNDSWLVGVFSKSRQRLQKGFQFGCQLLPLFRQQCENWRTEAFTTITTVIIKMAQEHDVGNESAVEFNSNAIGEVAGKVDQRKDERFQLAQVLSGNATGVGDDAQSLDLVEDTAVQLENEKEVVRQIRLQFLANFVQSGHHFGGVEVELSLKKENDILKIKIFSVH